MLFLIEVLFELDAFAPLADAAPIGFGCTAGDGAVDWAAVTPCDWLAELLFCASRRMGIFSFTRSKFLASSNDVT